MIYESNISFPGLETKGWTPLAIFGVAMCDASTVLISSVLTTGRGIGLYLSVEGFLKCS
jgi:hypothetical protein